MKVNIRLKYFKRGSNFESLIKFIEFMRKKDFNEAMIGSFTRASNLKKIQSIARGIILNEIYAVNVERDEDRSGHAYESFIAIPVSRRVKGNCGQISVISDISVAPAIAGEDKGRYSYVGFFEDPNIKGGSFIPPPGKLTPSRYRPFVGVMTNALADEATNMVHMSSKEVIKRKLPSKK